MCCFWVEFNCSEQYMMNVLNSLPGIKTNESCCGHGKNPITIFFNVYDDEWLFF